MKSQLDILDGAHKILGELMRTHPDLAPKMHEITFRLSRSRHNAGQVRRGNIINLSFLIFTDDSNFLNLRNTVTHEIAHVLSPPVRKGNRWDIHSWEWEMMHKSLGGSGNRCHTMQPAEAFQAVTYDVPCPACGQPIKLSRIRYKRQLAGRKYRHVTCPRKI